jgi:hypothetical protein
LGGISTLLLRRLLLLLLWSKCVWLLLLEEEEEVSLGVIMTNTEIKFHIGSLSSNKGMIFFSSFHS